MRNTANKVAVLFLAAASVYSGGAVPADGVANAHHNDNAASAGKTSAPAGPGTYFTKSSPAVAASDDAAARPAAKTLPAAGGPAPIADVPVIPVEPATTPAAPMPGADPFAQTTVVDPSATNGKSVTEDDVNYNDAAGTVEIHVNDASLVEVLRMLSLQSQRNIIASKEVKGTITANLYGVTVREALDAILTSNGYSYKEEGNFIYVYTAAELKEQQEAKRVRKTQVFRLYYTPVATAVNMIKPVLSKDGEVAFTDPAHVGLASGDAESGGNSHSTEDVMVITDYEANLSEAKRVIAEIDKRPQQILIEATILRATLNEDNALGVDFQVLGGVDFSGLSGAGTTFGAAAGGPILSDKGASNVVNNGYVAGGTGFTNNIPAGGLQIGVVKNNIAMFLEALETVTDTTVLANPKILALNKQKGEVIVGREDGYVTSTTTDTATVQTVEFLQTGTRLIFRPYIGDDGFVRMEIHPEDSSGGLTGANLPFKVTTEVTSNVLVRDGHTVVIGGLFREDSNSTRGQVPMLGNLPLAGPLFRSQRDRTTREEIIILLTPHIIKDDSAYAELSDSERTRMEQMRIGVRRGMMISGRERLAEGFYDSAVAEMAKPNANRSKALWNLNAAANLNPKFLEAIELKQQITGKQVTSVDNNIARDFVKKSVMADLAKERVDATTATEPVARAQPVPAAPVSPVQVTSASGERISEPKPLLELKPIDNDTITVTTATTTATTTRPSDTVGTTQASASALTGIFTPLRLAAKWTGLDHDAAAPEAHTAPVQVDQTATVGPQ